MASNEFKQIGNREIKGNNESKRDLSALIPFVRFGVNAMKMIANTLIGIVKSVPKPGNDKPNIKSRNKLIKID